MTYSYCDSLAPSETSKTCRDVGATASFKEKSRNNEVWAREAEVLRDEALAKYERTCSVEERTPSQRHWQKH